MKKLLFLIFFLVSVWSFSQIEVSVSRKIQRFENTQRDLQKIGTNKDENQDSIYFFVENKRIELAQNCPVQITNNLTDLTRNDLLENWILNFPLEYKNYVEFLEKYIRSHVHHL